MGNGLRILGGLIMLISVFLPVLYFSRSAEAFGIKASAQMYYWMFGYAYAQASVSAGNASYSASATHFEPDTLGIICMVIIIIGAIVAIAKEENGGILGGILGIIAMIAYIGVVYAGGYGLSPMGRYASEMVPFVGFFACIIGGIIAIIGGKR